MSRVIAIILFCVCAASANAQNKTLINPPTSGKNTINHYADGLFADSVQFFPTGSGYPSINMANYMSKVSLGALQYDVANHIWWSFDPSTGLWDTLSSSGGGGGGGETILPAGPFVTSNVGIGYDPGTNLTAAEIIQKVWYGTRPSATLTGGTTIELTSASTVSQTLNWGATRQVGATTLATIVVAGVSQSFSQPVAGGTVSGTQAVSVPANISTTYSNVVTASDAQTITATTTFNFQNKIYAGFVTSTSPTSADILAATSSTYVGGRFSTSKNQSGSLTTPSGAKYVMFANPVSFGIPNVVINGLGVIYTISILSFTNASGYTSNYYVAISPFVTSGAIDSYVVN